MANMQVVWLLICYFSLYVAGDSFVDQLVGLQAAPASASFEFSSGIEGASTSADGSLFLCDWNPSDVYNWNSTTWSQAPANVAVLPSANVIALFRTVDKGGQCAGTVWGNDKSLYMADFHNHRVLRFRTSDGETVLGEWAEDARMNQPNDVTITPNQQYLFLTDPKWSDSTGALWRVRTDDNSSLVKLPFALGTTNGLAVAPDGTKLFVGQSKQHNILVFDLDQGTGELSNQQVFYEETGNAYEFDGMECDVCGNLFVTRNIGGGDVIVLDSDGKQVGAINVLGTKPSNLAFGGADGRTVYVTEVSQGRVVSFRAPLPGALWCSKNPSAQTCLDACNPAASASSEGSRCTNLAAAVVGTFLATALLAGLAAAVAIRRAQLASTAVSEKEMSERASSASVKEM
jgi:sugar lactone lactonase YvrE